MVPHLGTFYKRSYMYFLYLLEFLTEWGVGKLIDHLLFKFKQVNSNQVQDKYLCNMM
jgi:hypothetical protein